MFYTFVGDFVSVRNKFRSAVQKIDKQLDSLYHIEISLSVGKEFG